MVETVFNLVLSDKNGLTKITNFKFQLIYLFKNLHNILNINLILIYLFKTVGRFRTLLGILDEDFCENG